jgi:hypothetical protein
MTALSKLTSVAKSLLALAALLAAAIPARAAVAESAGWGGMEPIRDPAVILRRLAERKQQQVAEAVVRRAFHDFQFVNRLTASGIQFKGNVVDDVAKYNFPIHYDHGTGLAVADVDGDGRLDVYFVSQLGGNELWKNLGGGKFANFTTAAGVGLKDRVSVAASFADVDNDGDADLFVTTVRTGNALFENLGGGRFRDISKEAGVDYAGHSSGAVFFDFNNDGLLDLFVGNVGRYTTDRRGRGGYFIGVTNAFSAHLKPELSESSLLYQNLGGRKFRDVSAEVLRHTGWSGDAAFGDVNGDGWPDLYVLSMQGDDKFYENAGGRKFVEQTAAYFPKTPWGAMGVKFFDFNNDGRLDLYVTDMHSDMTGQQTALQRNFSRGIEKAKSEAFCTFEWTEEYLQGSSNNIFGNAFYQNLGNGRFAEVSDVINAETFWPWGISVADFNADGFPDVFTSSGMGFPYGYAMNSVLLNEAGQRFFDAEFLVGVEPRAGGRVTLEYFTLDCAGEDRNHPFCQGQTGRISVHGTASSRSSVAFDVDGDGDLDLLTNELTDQPQVFLSNLTEKRKVNFLQVKLTGAKSNRDGLGALVKVQAGGLTQTQQHDGKSGYLSQSSLPLYFGLGDATKVDRVEVRWPAGKTQVVTANIQPNATLSLVEPKD